MPTGKENSNNSRMFFFNSETGEWTPLMSIDTVSCEINLSEEDAARLYDTIFPMGDLEIVPNPERPNNGKK